MNSWTNFPASDFMTDFETIVIQSEITRNRIREREIKDQGRRTDDAPLLNLQAPTMDIIPQPTSPHSEDILSKDISIQEDDSSIDTDSSSDEDLEEDTTGETWDSAKSNISTKSMNRSLSDTKDQNSMGRMGKSPIPIHNNTTEFMNTVNDLNVSKGKKRIIISSIRPSFQSDAHHDFFLCHFAI